MIGMTLGLLLLANREHCCCKKHQMEPQLSRKVVLPSTNLAEHLTLPFNIFIASQNKFSKIVICVYMGGIYEKAWRNR